MFKNGPIDGVVVDSLKRYHDGRGWLLELFREDEVDSAYVPVMGYISETHPGVQRGPHEHVDQADLFVFMGPGNFRMVLWDNRPQSPTFQHRLDLLVGEVAPARVLVPPGVVHGYRNVGTGPGIVYNFPNRLYKGPKRAEPVDEIRHEDDPNTPYRMP